jgi:hypothetical protein
MFSDEKPPDVISGPMSDGELASAIRTLQGTQNGESSFSESGLTGSEKLPLKSE